MHRYKRWVIYIAVPFLLIAASIVNAQHLYYMAAALLALPGISYLVGVFALRDLEFDRDVPGAGFQGEIVSFAIVARSRSRLPRLFIQCRDHLPEWLEAARPTAPMFNVPAGGSTRTPYQVELRKRGAHRIEWMTVVAMDPLGIFSFARRLNIVSEILVYPVPEPMPDLALSGAEQYGYRDLPIASTRGSGVEPDGIREYVPGDPLRRVHWKSTARTGRLNTIEFEESRAYSVLLALDLREGTDVGSGKDTTLEYLVRAAASLAQASIRHGATVQLLPGGEPGAGAASGRGSDHLLSILAALAPVRADRPRRLVEWLAPVSETIRAGTTLVVLTAAMEPDLPGLIANCTASGSPVVVFYADPRSFGARAPSAEQTQGFLEDLIAAGARPALLRRTESGRLEPEPVKNASIVSTD